MISKKLFYCFNCNEVHASKDFKGDCNKLQHKKAFITDKQYIDWVLNDKQKLNIKIKQKNK